ncbi:MAG: hypothetical protein KAT83_01235, partial [Candidatus Aenigmarchaeota archaeon]|nr:hypothetical protein [Candidatus Aenigmarchaeota archaeon]
KQAINGSTEHLEVLTPVEDDSDSGSGELSHILKDSGSQSPREWIPRESDHNSSNFNNPEEENYNVLTPLEDTEDEELDEIEELLEVVEKISLLVPRLKDRTKRERYRKEINALVNEIKKGL